MMDINHINQPNMGEFCSQKLWRIISEERDTSPDELEAAVRELAQRRHYLIELEKLGKFNPRS